MTFLNPWSALLAAAVAVPLLLLLYFLKLRRQTMRIASTMLWLKSTVDLQANVPFQRLRWSLLLLLQLLAVASLVAALARPVVQAAAAAPARLILLIDRSASMSATDGGGAGRTRLEAARAAARATVGRLGRRSEPVQMMIVAFASSAEVVTGFESNRRVLLEAIDAIEPTDEEADLESALELAGAFASRDESGGETPPEVVLISDGGVAAADEPAGGFTLQAGGLRFVGVGPDSPDAINNVGIVALSARRDYREPGRVLVFGRLANAGPRPIETTATLRLDGDPVNVKSVTVPRAGSGGPGEAPVSFVLDDVSGAVLTLSVGHRDVLPADNTAALVLRAPTAPRIALVHAGDEPDPFLFGLLEALEPQRLIPLAVAPDEQVQLPWTVDDIDLVVFQGVSPRRLPDIPSLSFGGAPHEVPIAPPGRPGGRRILSWDRQHPLMRHVSLDTLVYSGFGGFELPPEWTGLAFGPDGPVIAARSTGSVGHVLVGFDLLRSNWPLHVSITVFMQNVIDVLAPGARGDAALALRPGAPVVVRVTPGATKLHLEGPVEADVVVAGAEATLPALPRVGLYTVRGAVPPLDMIAINMASDVETDIRPRRTLDVNARPAEAGAVSAATPLELWPWLAAVAIALLVVEWVVYCLKVRG